MACVVLLVVPVTVMDLGVREHRFAGYPICSCEVDGVECGLNFALVPIADARYSRSANDCVSFSPSEGPASRDANLNADG